MRPWEKKALLKRVAARWLPRDVVYRPKHGFSIPLDAWFRGPWAAAAHADHLLGAGAEPRLFRLRLPRAAVGGARVRAASHGTRFWSLLWLEIWFRMFVDGTMRPGSRLSDVAVGQ